MWAARLCWQRGLETGFELLRVERVTRGLAAAARDCRERLDRSELRAMLWSLEAAGWFEMAAVQESAAALGAAVAGLERSLDAACGPG